ncbi:MAG TPA: hypothetical protein VFE52_07310, partial [Devosia sp.]|nr:hypothetical protein [Devosia sp.]
MVASKTMVGALSAWFGLALSLLVAAPAAAQAIATAVDVRPEATGEYNGTDVVLSAEDDLFEGQTVTTGPVGQVQIVFADETHMVVGPSSS